MPNLKSHSEEIIDAVNLTNSFCKELSEVDSHIVLRNVISLFTKDAKYVYPLWERVINSLSVRVEHAWEKFEELFRGREIILFFDTADDNKMLLFSDGGQLSRVFEHCYKFVFYVTDKQNSFLLSYNDHDFLIGSGEAKQWIDRFW